MAEANSFKKVLDTRSYATVVKQGKAVVQTASICKQKPKTFQIKTSHVSFKKKVTQVCPNPPLDKHSKSLRKCSQEGSPIEKKTLQLGRH